MKVKSVAIYKLILSACLLVLSQLLAASPSAAQGSGCNQCDANALACFGECQAMHSDCIFNGYPSWWCDSLLSTCFQNCSDAHSGCLSSCAGGNGNSGGGSGGGQRSPGYAQCAANCDDQQSSCVANGGSGNPAVTNCITGGGTVEQCCQTDYRGCLRGC